ncbi:30S ribosome-binding factor RbfA [Nitrosomonas sp.]|uniref:30S ribosome-binding factor RbfA n=1 Tax=Nitrosomonas sp. TaxID=42353 RepID=UPI001D782D81|nr:30S ribosome-binding factor RbfA [Nitrosomonas sp.]MCB1949459.1 30S ribosome-binding factor RbfA [Nitrosomonas sp.]MCP5242040.1 30S ribosome-binding factor RbfA [Burkholderiales bacterium]MDR4515179.1 30S ribosome-binding factor RbfA [Nitrosomonas sp.]
MPKDFHRSLRVADQIQRELADMLSHEIKDPRLKKITITAVEASRDYSYAKVFYTAMGSQEENILIEKGLEKASGFLRSGLSKRIKLRVVPQLIFIYDKSIEQGAYLSRLIDEAIAQENKDNN